MIDTNTATHRRDASERILWWDVAENLLEDSIRARFQVSFIQGIFAVHCPRFSVDN